MIQMNWRRPVAVLGALLALGLVGCAKRPASVVVPLKFRPTSQMNMNTFAGDLPESSVHVGPVNDVRDNRDQIGENLEERTPVAIIAGGPVEPAQFVHDVMRNLMTRAGVSVADDPAGGDRLLVADLHQFWTKETGTYDGEVRATVTVQDRSGRQLWKGTINGTAERFGRSLKAENYQEVFSDAMINMVEGLLNNAGFRAALKRDARPAGGQ